MTKKSGGDTRIITSEKLETYRGMLMEDEKSAATIAQYMHCMERFLSFAGDRKITKALSVQFKQKLKDAGCYAPRTVNTVLAAVNSFFKHMGWYDCIVKTEKIHRDTFRAIEKELTKADYKKAFEDSKETGERAYLSGDADPLRHRNTGKRTQIYYRGSRKKRLCGS